MWKVWYEMSAYLDKEWKNILINSYIVMETGEKYSGNHFGSFFFLKIILLYRYYSSFTIKLQYYEALKTTIMETI